MFANPWIIAIAIAVVCAALEAWFSGPRPFTVLASFRQPRWGLPLWGWMMVGALFYVMMAYGVAVALQAGQSGRVALMLVVAVLVTDGLWNLLLLRRRRVDLAYYYLYPYALLVAAAAYTTLRIDTLAGAGLSIYLAFLAYDILWTRAVMRLNPAAPD